MGLFDAIKYPITDIFDGSQVNCLPRPILEEWGKMLAELAGSETALRMLKDKNMNFSILAFICILTRCPRSGVYQQNETFFAFKAYFTAELKKLILEYEQESST